jgi:branched-chain amino acid transport system permease protein
MFSSRYDLKWLRWALPALAILVVLPFLAPRFYVYTMATMLYLGLLAMSLNLVLGYGGIYQFHHAVFYGFGAYAVALLLSKTSLPLWAAFLAGPIFAAALSLVMGLLCVRLSKLYFGMFQISLGSLVWAVAFRWKSLTGGDDGIQGIPLPQALSSITGSYYFVLIVSALCIVSMAMIVSSPFGSILKTIRDNPNRSMAIGVNVKRHQVVSLVIAGFYAGIAGMLFVVVEGSVFPALMFWTLSLEALIMCLLGGFFTFMGPMLGAGVIVALRTFVGSYTEYWTLVESIIFLLVIFFLPQGVLGYITDKLSAAGRKNQNRGAAHVKG